MLTLEDYPQVYTRLNTEVATVVFVKKNGDIRIMFATRSRSIAGLLHENAEQLRVWVASRDNNSNIRNGNIAVIDLVLGQVRQFNIERVVCIEFDGDIKTKEELDRAFETYEKLKSTEEKLKNEKVGLDMLND